MRQFSLMMYPRRFFHFQNLISNGTTLFIRFCIYWSLQALRNKFSFAKYSLRTFVEYPIFNNDEEWTTLWATATILSRATCTLSQQLHFFSQSTSGIFGRVSINIVLRKHNTPPNTQLHLFRPQSWLRNRLCWLIALRQRPFSFDIAISAPFIIISYHPLRKLVDEVRIEVRFFIWKFGLWGFFSLASLNIQPVQIGFQLFFIQSLASGLLRHCSQDGEPRWFPTIFRQFWQMTFYTKE